MHQLLTLYHFLQLHPLYWQAPLTMLTASGLFDWFKHKVALEGKKTITGYLTALGTIIVILHLAIVGATFASPLGLLKMTAQQTVFFIGGLNLVYNFLTHGVTKFLQDAQAEATTPSTTPSQKNPALSSAVEAGVAPF